MKHKINDILIFNSLQSNKRKLGIDNIIAEVQNRNGVIAYIDDLDQKLDKPNINATSLFNYVVVIDENGNSAKKSLGDFAQSGGEPNTIEIVKRNNVVLDIGVDKSVNINVPTKTSELNNNSGFITISSIPTMVSAFQNDAGYLTSSDGLTVDLSDYYTKSEVDTKITSIYRFKGSVNTFNSLPNNNNTIGDVYNVIDTDMNYGWDGTEWDALGSSYGVNLNLSTYNNDAGFITLADIPQIPTIVSAFQNDAGYITMSNLPTLLSELNNDVGYITIADIPVFSDAITSIKVNNTTQTITNKSVNITVPTKTSNLTNDSGFLVSGSFRTLNNISLIGSGDITLIQGSNISISQTGTAITIASTNTTYLTGDLPMLNTGTSVEGRLWGAKTIKDFVMTNIPTIPSVNNGTLTISSNNGITGSGTFTANQSSSSSVTLGLTQSVINDINKGVSAYDKIPSGLTITGDETKTIKLTLADASTLQASFNVNNSDTNTWRPIKIQGVSGSSTNTDVLGNTVASQPLTLKAGNNIGLTHSNGVITITSSYTNTTYAGGNGLTISNNIISQVFEVVTSPGANVVTKVEQTNNGVKVTEGYMPFLEAQELYVTQSNIVNNMVTITTLLTIYKKSAMVFINGVKLPKAKITITENTITINNDNLLTPIEIGDYIEIEHLTL